MTFLHTVAAEARKTAALPATLVALGVAVLGPVAITLLNAVGVRNAVRAGRPDLVAYTAPAESVFSAVPLGTVGAVILGVVVVGSEYTASRSDAGGGRQITATLTAVPGRLRVLAAKAAVVTLLVAAVAAVTIPGSLALATVVAGDAAGAAPDDLLSRAFGAGLYWALTALMALAITVFTRSGIIPIIVLVVNSSLMSVSLLLSHLTPLARYLPDAAGMKLFSGDLLAFDDALAPLPGGLVMAAWTAVLLVAAAVVFTRRDA